MQAARERRRQREFELRQEEEQKLYKEVKEEEADYKRRRAAYLRALRVLWPGGGGPGTWQAAKGDACNVVGWQAGTEVLGKNSKRFRAQFIRRYSRNFQ